jgi:TonB-linked SusC/RagA family outer membrane protein
MQEFATSKVPALGRALYQQLLCLTKSRRAVRIMRFPPAFSRTESHRPKIKTIERAMKLTAIFLMGACLQLSANGISQTITLSLKDAPMQKVFREIERQTDYVFFVETDVLNNTKKVSLSVNYLSLTQVLDLCFKDQPITYSFSGKMIIVAPKKKQLEINLKASVEQPPVEIKGRVLNSKGEPISDATVSVQGSSKRTITNANGEFTISGVDGNAVIVISHVQYETMTVSVKENGLITATLQLKVSSLDELQIIAYGTTSRRFTTGNVASVKASDIEKQPVTNPLLALQGRVPGIEITQTTGLPGAGVKVQIQGVNTLRFSDRSATSPLVVIDGVPYPSQLQNLGLDNLLLGGSSLNFINPNDIESIDILKDADATAIYGSRAANGAILITTKKGRSGKTKFSLDMQKGWGKVGHFIDMMNTRQYLDMRYEALKNDNISLSTLNQNSNYDLTVWDTTRNTNWQKELIGGTAQYTNINASLSGGTTALQYFISGAYNKQTTVFPGGFDDKRGAMHFNIGNSSGDQKFKVQLSGNYMYDDNHLSAVDLTQRALTLAPNAPALYTDDGNLNWAPNVAGTSTLDNPLADLLYSEYNNTTKSLISNLSVSYRILPGLEIRSSFGYTNIQSSIYQPIRIEIEKPERRATASNATNFGKRDMNSWLIEPQSHYSGSVGKGKVDGLLGFSVQQSNAEGFTVTGSGYSSYLLMRTLAAPTVYGTAIYSNSRFNGLFGRLNYIWNKRYIINLTARRDGSSKFGDANKMHNFGSAALGWIFTEENWMRTNIPILSFGKLRVSYGTTGNDQIGDFGHLSLYSIVNPTIQYQGITGLQPNKIPNPHLQWEETRKLQTGIDLGFLNDRILLGATYVRNRSSNQLVNYILPSTTGFSTISQNLPALIQNTSWEFTLSSVNIKSRQFQWSMSANLTVPRNKLLSFPGIENTSYASGLNGIIVGEPVGATKVYDYGGVDPATGKYVVYDKDGNLTSNPVNADKTIVISNNSKYYGGIQHSVSYKGFQLDLNFQFVRQSGAKNLFFFNDYNNLPPGSYSSDNLMNQPITVLNRWRKPGEDAEFAKFTTQGNSGEVNVSLPKGSNSGYSYDASFIRLKNVSFSWQMPNGWIKKAKFQNVRLFFLGQNLMTITKYTGFDPENLSVSSLPPLQIWTIGMHLEL